MRIGRKAIIGAVVAATTAGTMLAAAPRALAVPGNCTVISPDASPVSSVCTSGTGYQQIDVVMYMPGDGENAVVGNCAAVGQVSTVNVPWPVILYAFANVNSCN
jgi:hypothetical protein